MGAAKNNPSCAKDSLKIHKREKNLAGLQIP